MCELFAMSSCRPATVTFALKEFQSHGGDHHRNEDGWGMAFYDEVDARILRDTTTARESSYFNFIKDHQHPSHCVISHIRQATVGEVSLRNTQPFVRELWGRLHCFAHNGDLTFDAPVKGPLEFQPIGNTDSELAFCDLLTRLKKLVNEQGARPTLDQRINFIRDFSREYRERGTFNFFYSDGEYLFVHGHRRTQSDGEMRPPGMYILQRDDHHHDHEHQKATGLKIHTDEIISDMVLVASVPLTEEGWEPLQTGAIAVLRFGELMSVHEP